MFCLCLLLRIFQAMDFLTRRVQLLSRSGRICKKFCGKAFLNMELIGSRSVNHRSIFIFFLGLFVISLATEHVLRLKDPPESAVLISVPVNSSVTLRCEKSPNMSELQWLHNGNDLNFNVLRASGEHNSSLHIACYSTKHHDGVYECYSGAASASIRLRGEEEVVLPVGFRLCHKSENAACDHARACMADGTGKTSCVCYSGWSGESCNLPQDIQKANLINVPVCPYWPPVITLMVFIFCVFILLVCVYKYKNRPPSKSLRYRGSKRFQNYSTVKTNELTRKEVV